MELDYKEMLYKLRSKVAADILNIKREMQISFTKDDNILNHLLERIYKDEHEEQRKISDIEFDKIYK